MRFTGPQMIAMSMAAQAAATVAPAPSRDEVAASELIHLLNEFNKAEGYEAVDAIAWTGEIVIGRAYDYTCDNLSRKWYEFEITQGELVETGWMAMDDATGFKYAEDLD